MTSPSRTGAQPHCQLQGEAGHNRGSNSRPTTDSPLPAADGGTLHRAQRETGSKFSSRRAKNCSSTVPNNQGLYPAKGNLVDPDRAEPPPKYDGDRGWEPGDISFDRQLLTALPAHHRQLHPFGRTAQQLTDGASTFAPALTSVRKGDKAQLGNQPPRTFAPARAPAMGESGPR